jgi:TfoX/Sxy family transcriptional regulator of competence genes
VRKIATSKDYKEFILEQLDLLGNITCRAMMGEYLLYYNNILFGGIYDNKLLVKIVASNKKYNMKEQIPYKNAKPMYLVDDIDNKEGLKEIIIETCKDLSAKK